MAARLASLALGIAILVGWGSAQAQTATLTLPNTVGTSGGGLVSTTVGGWTVTISGCVQKNASYSVAPSDCATSQAVITATANGLSVVFQNVTNGQPLLSSAYGSPFSDLYFNMVVTAPGTQSIVSSSVTMAGSVTPGYSSDLVDLTTGVTLVANSTTYSGLATNLANSPVLQSLNIAPANTVAVQGQDIKVSTAPAHSGDNAMQITSVTDTFKVPEPLSLSCFSIGLAGLAFARRRTGRRDRNDIPG